MKPGSLRSHAAVLLAGALQASVPASAQAAAAGAGAPAEFVTGGVAKEDADYLRAQAASYSLELTFSKSTREGQAFAADVQVVVRDAQGNVVLSIPSAEPILLARLPPGRYSIAATLDGRTRTAEVSLGGGHQKVGFTW